MARNPGKAYTEFQNGDQDIARSDGTNKFDIYCPQESCRCKLLLAASSTLVSRDKSKLKLPTMPIGATVSTIEDSPENKTTTTESSSSSTSTTTAPPPPIAIANTTDGDMQSFWRVTDMMAFENIGFSKMLPSGIQFLSCADCDTGPLGYHDKSPQATSKEFLVAVNRVRYHDRS
ncbi:hypothetical protein BG004_002509 [Podila humilis]|nr:hypothetical protein BG004_002509 [Podila humilis]